MDQRPRPSASARRLWGALALVIGVAVPAIAPTAAGASEVAVSGTFLLVEGDPDDDAITVSTDGNTITVTDTGTGGATAGDNCLQANATAVACPATLPGQPPVSRFDVQLGDGTDSFTNQNFETDLGFVGAGSGPKTIAGGPGSQSLNGGSDDDTIDGGAGDDVLSGGGSAVETTGGNDVLVGGPGVDSTGYFRAAPVTITLDGQANDGEAGEADNVQVENVQGGFGDDTLIGDDGPNELSGANGSDVVRGMGGNDSLFGESELPAVVSRGIIIIGGGGPGDDTLDGGAGRDGLNCGRGFDLALRDPLDEVRANCERIGAGVVGDSAKVTGKRKRQRFRVRIHCPEAELKACRGSLEVTLDGKRIGKGKFSVPNGETKGARARLSKQGRRKLKRARGSMLVDVWAATNQPGGVSVDARTVFIYR